MNSLKGKVAVVTGSGQGIGRGIALFFAAEGAKVVTNNRKPVTVVEKRQEGETEQEYQSYVAMRGDAEGTAQMIRERGGEAIAFYGDVSDYETARRMIETTVETYGRIDILVNNAAGLGQGTVVETTEQEWEVMTKAKMKGAFNTMHHAIPYMIKQGGGRILNCASNAWIGMANLSAYSAGNAGVVGLTKAAAKELAKSQITVNAYCPQANSPGHVREFNKTIRNIVATQGEAARPSEEKLAAVERSHGDAYDLAPFLAWLCTEDAAKVSGSVFGVTGSGLIERYSEPEVVAAIQAEKEPWTVEKLQEVLSDTLFADYESKVFTDDWKKKKETKIVEKKNPKPLFPKGARMDAFEKETYIHMMTKKDDPSGCSIGNVTFSPGARNDWHTHDGYQFLLVTDGEGYYQEWGKEVVRLHPGDVVRVEPGVKHWHGAAEDQWFSHIGMVVGGSQPDLPENLFDVFSAF